jgi:hypothetical protein
MPLWDLTGEIWPEGGNPVLSIIELSYSMMEWLIIIKTL